MEQIMKKYYIIIIVLVVFSMGLTVLHAGDASRVGTAAGVQLLVPVGARDLAMGGADLAHTSGINAMYWNPAGLASMKSNAAGQFSTMTIFNDVSVNYLGIGVNSEDLGAFGFSIKSFDFGDIPYTTNQDMDGSSGRTFSPTFVTAGLTYSNMLTDVIQVGFTTKLIHESIPRASATSFAFDVGIQYHNLGKIEGVDFGLVLKNIGANMQYEGSGLLHQAQEQGSAYDDFRERPSSSDQLPSSLEIGVSYIRSINEENSVIVSSIFQNNNFENDRYKFGLEYGWQEMIFLRGGYLYAVDTPSEDVLYTFTLGAGFSYDLGGTNIKLDYVFRDSQYFDGNNLFSIQLGF